MVDVIANSYIELLKELISTRSFSKEEDQTASIIEHFLSENGIETSKHLNNVWAVNKHYNPELPSLLLNSHHDTVKPNPGYTRDPFSPEIESGKLYGLGSNDAGGALVSLIAAFVHFYSKPDLKYNVIIAATAEEEISGKDGIESILDKLPAIELAIVGEPTLMDMAIAEKGLMVLDCTARGISGHAARNEGKNAIYDALEDIAWFKDYRFPNESKELGPVKMTTTIINAGSQHNVLPAECSFTVDVRTTNAYSNEQVLEIIDKHTNSNVEARSLRLKPSSIPEQHPLVTAGKRIGRKTYGSPTTSDQAVIPATSLKMGPGDSARSHSADEFIYISEIEQGIDIYIEMLEQFLLN